MYFDDRFKDILSSKPDHLLKKISLDYNSFKNHHYQISLKSTYNSSIFYSFSINYQGCLRYMLSLFLAFSFIVIQNTQLISWVSLTSVESSQMVQMNLSTFCNRWPVPVSSLHTLTSQQFHCRQALSQEEIQIHQHKNKTIPHLLNTFFSISLMVFSFEVNNSTTIKENLWALFEKQIGVFDLL